MDKFLLMDFDDYRFFAINENEDVEKICDLFEDVFNHPMNKSLWLWKYKKAPKGDYIGVGVEEKSTGQLIGYMGVLITPGFFKEKSIFMGQVCDVMLRNDFRSGIGKDSLYQRMHISLGKLSQLWRIKNGNIDFYMYGFPGNRPAKLGKRLNFYRHLYVCQENLYASNQSVKNKFSILNKISKLFFKAKKIEYLIGSTEAVLIDKFWLRYKNENSQRKVLIEKNSDYLNWRYFMNPDNKYDFWVFFRYGKIVGWLVTREIDSPIVIDYAFLEKRFNLKKSLDMISSPDKVWKFWGGNEKNSMQTPINAVEFMGEKFYDYWPSPSFQPGDTDVF